MQNRTLGVLGMVVVSVALPGVARGQTGACCDLTGTLGACSLRAAADCPSGSRFLGAGSTCMPNACPQPGACCLSQGGCVLATEPVCAAGTFLGAGSVCTPNPCPQLGACCAGATCTVTLANRCTGAFSSFVVGAGACNPAGNPATPCCLANYDQRAGVGLDDIFLYLAGWFRQESRTDIDGSRTVTLDDLFVFLAAWFRGCR